MSASTEIMEKFQLKINFVFRKSEIYHELFKNKAADFGKNEFDDQNLYSWKMFFKKAKHLDYLNLYLMGCGGSNTIIKSYKFYKVTNSDTFLLDFSYDSTEDLWKCKKFCHKKSLSSKYQESNEQYRIRCEIELWRSRESAVLDINTKPSEHMENILLNGKFQDVICIAEGAEFKAHKSILIEVSPVFESLLCVNKGQSRIEFQTMRSAAVKEMLLFIYTGKIRNIEVLPDLLNAAENYEISALKNYCNRVAKTKLSKDTVLPIILCSEKQQDEMMKTSCLNFIKENARDLKGIFTTKNWVKLVECNSKLADVITDIINGETSSASPETEITHVNPPSYDSIFQEGGAGPSGIQNQQSGTLYPNLLIDFNSKSNISK